MDSEGNHQEMMEALAKGKAHELLKAWREEYGPVFIYYMKDMLTDQLIANLVIADADLAKQEIKKFHMKDPSYKHIYVLGQQGILSTDNYEQWNKQRKALSKVLSHTMVTSKSNVIIDDYMRFIQSSPIQQAIMNCEPIDLFPHIINMMFKILVHSAFGTGVDFSDHEIDEIRHAFDTCVEFGMLKIDHDDATHKEAIDVVNRFVQKIHDNIEPEQNSIYGVIKSTDETGQYIFSTTEQNNLLTTFLFAGHETTAKTLHWILIELAMNLHVQDKLAKEIMHSSYDKLTDVKYMTAVIHETMRKWPVVPVGTFRYVPKRMEILGDMFEAGTIVSFNIDLVHNSDKWENPHLFDPDREKVPGHFYPFSLPPRDCLGRHLAMLEIRIILYKFLQEYTVSTNEMDIGSYYMGTMQSDRTVLFNIKQRVQSNL